MRFIQFLFLCLSVNSYAMTVYLSPSEETAQERDAFITQLKLVIDARLENKLDVLTIESNQNVSELFDYETRYNTAYKNGDMYFMVGNLDNSWTESEWKRFYSISKWLVKKGFRNILNPVAYIPDLREAVQNPHTSGIIWSSHGTENGTIWDSANKPIPYDIFNDQVGPRFKHIVLSNCYGNQTVKLYQFASQVNTVYWTGKTTSDQLFTLLLSDRWNQYLEKHLGIDL